MRITKVNKLPSNILTREIQVTAEQIERWQKGELIQNVMPELTEDEREFLISGLLPHEWEKLFSENEDTEQN